MNSLIVALVAGATAVASEVAADAVKDAYKGLKHVLKDVYKVVSLELLEKSPKSDAVVEAVEEEISNLDNLDEDAVLNEKIDAVNEALAALPKESQQAIGIDVEVIESEGDIHIINVTSTGTAIRGKKIKSSRNIKFIDIHGGSNSSNS